VPVTLALAIGCFAMFGYAVHAQVNNGYEPCPLCIFQRVAVIALGTTLLLAALVPWRFRVLGNLSVLLAGVATLAGIGLAARHLYLQSLPPGSVPACGATLSYMLDVFPLADVLRKVLTGSGECAKVDWTLFGLSMPGWVLISVTIFGGAGIAANWRGRRESVAQ
jgi:disulfide bond formation protein DsbB